MTSEQCRRTMCPYFDKFSGKAVCKFLKLTTGNHPKQFVKHLQSCPKVRGPHEVRDRVGRAEAAIAPMLTRSAVNATGLPNAKVNPYTICAV